MAFVFQSKRNLESIDNKNSNLGPGFYNINDNSQRPSTTSVPSKAAFGSTSQKFSTHTERKYS